MGDIEDIRGYYGQIPEEFEKIQDLDPYTRSLIIDLYTSCTDSVETMSERGDITNDESRHIKDECKAFTSDNIDTILDGNITSFYRNIGIGLDQCKDISSESEYTECLLNKIGNRRLLHR